MSGDYWESVERIAAAYIAWDTHIGAHYCKAASGEGACAVGDELLRRLHSAGALLSPEDRRRALDAIREWDWDPDDALYPQADS